MSSRELSEWMAYAEIEPFGEEQADRRIALLMAQIEAITAKRGRKRRGVEGFLKLLRPVEERPPSAEELYAALSARAAADARWARRAEVAERRARRER